jgi:hypothetical protein
MTYKGLDPRFVQRIVFDGTSPRGELNFAPAFDATL